MGKRLDVRRNRAMVRVAGYAISALCIVFLATRVDWNLFVRYFQGAQPGPLVLALLFVMATYVPFALRWRLLLSFVPKPSMFQVCSILMLGHFANMLLPMRAGDALRVVLIRNAYGHGAARVVSSILLERLFDVVTVLALGSVVALSATLPDAVLVFLRTAAFAAALGIVMVILVTLRAKVAGALLARMVRPFSDRVAGAVAEHVGHFADAVDTIFPKDRKSASRVATIVGLSFWGWGSFGVAMALCAVAFGVVHSIPAGFSLMVVTNLGSAIPSSPASIGVYEALGILALSPWVSAASLAVVIASVSHAIAIIVQFSFGLLAMALRQQGISKELNRLPTEDG